MDNDMNAENRHIGATPHGEPGGWRRLSDGRANIGHPGDGNADRYRVRCDLPLVLHRQAAAGASLGAWPTRA